MAKKDLRKELCGWGKKIAAAGLVAGAGGNISVRDGEIIWMKPSGLALDEMTPADLSGIRISDGVQVKGKRKPTSEVNMHLGIYRVRTDCNTIFHTHSPWAGGVLSSGVEFKPMFPEFVVDLGVRATVPYITATTQKLADAVAKAARKADTIFLLNHGVVALGVEMKQAFFRSQVVEDAAKSLIAACIVGKPRFLTKKEQDELMSLGGVKARIAVMQKG
jgi:L-fuculose-phosphate aldolase